jgi:hypothetical protein
MIVIESTYSGPKVIINRLSIISDYRDVILRTELKNKKLCSSLLTAISIITAEQSFTTDSEVITYYPTTIKEFETNLDDTLKGKYYTDYEILSASEIELRARAQKEVLALDLSWI